MAARTPAASTIIKNQTEEIAKLTKQLADEKASKDRYNKEREDLSAEIEQVHALLDVLPGAAGRKTEHEESYYRKDIKMMTRLSSYLAARAAA